MRFSLICTAGTNKLDSRDSCGSPLFCQVVLQLDVSALHLVDKLASGTHSTARRSDCPQLCGLHCPRLALQETTNSPASTRRSSNVGSMLGQRRRRWPIIEPTLLERFVFALSATIATADHFNKKRIQ